MRRLGRYLTSLISATMLLLALSGHRRYFFVLLCLVVRIGAAVLALTAHRQDATGWTWVMIGVLVLFSPLLPIHLPRNIWRIVDVMVAGVFVTAALAMPGSRTSGAATAR